MINKPVLVIVDDEVDLLANIRECFEDENYDHILNLKARSSGEKAVDLAKELKEKGEQVALLLTDMVMPGMKGFQVIEEYKKLFPDVVPMILTGYADKESAIRAINLGEVKAYFEKPWQNPSQNIFPKINKHLRKYFSETHGDICFILKQLGDNPQELEDFFTGRYLVWQQQGWRDQNVQWLDIDEYDFYSTMICAFEKRFNYFGFAGGLRKTVQDKETGNRAVIEKLMEEKRYILSDADLREHREYLRDRVIAEHKINELLPDESSLATLLRKKGISKSDFLGNLFQCQEVEVNQYEEVVQEYEMVEKNRLCELPAMKVHNKRQELTKYFKSLFEEDEKRKVAEVGRLGILSKYRGRYHGMTLNDRLHEEITALGINMGVTDGIICCNPVHYRFFYKSLGFEPIPGVSEEKYYKLNAPSMAYRLDGRNLFNPEKVKLHPKKRDRILTYLEKLKKVREQPLNHVSCMCANLEACIEDGFQEPLEEPVGHHCPLRVQRFLSAD